MGYQVISLLKIININPFIIGGQIAGIVLGSVFGFAAIVGVIVLIVKKVAGEAAAKAYLSKLKKGSTTHQPVSKSPSAALQTEAVAINGPDQDQSP